MSELFPEPAPDFSNPLGLIRACHQRMLRHLELLEKVCTHLQSDNMDQQVADAAKQVHRYFTSAAVTHHRDEEDDIFPLVVRTSLKMAQLIHGLKKDHQKLEQLWLQLEPGLGKLQSIESPEDFIQHAQEFCSAYRHHIQVEENEFLNLAQHLLSKQQLEEIGENMEERRKPVSHPRY